MAFEFARNIQDKLLTPAPFALPAAASTSTQSTAVDFDTSLFQPENVEVELSVPALSATIVPNGNTVTYIIEASNASNFATIDRVIVSRAFTGAGGAGVPAQAVRGRLPSDCPRYVRGKVTFGASTTTGAAISASFKPLF